MPTKYILEDDNNEQFTNKFEAYKFREQRLYDNFKILQGYSKQECQQLIQQIENLESNKMYDEIDKFGKL